MSTNDSRQRIGWLCAGLVISASLIVTGIVAIGFETMTGRLSGTVVQATITEYGIGADGHGKLGIQSCRLSSAKFDLHLDAVPVSQSGTNLPYRMSSGLAWLRRLAWKEKTFGPSMAFALDKPASVEPLISRGDVFSLLPGESAILLTYEGSYTTERWAVILRCDPLLPPPAIPVAEDLP